MQMCHLHNSIRPGTSSSILSHQLHDSICLECVEFFWSSELTGNAWNGMHDKLCDFGHGILDLCTSFTVSTLVNDSSATKLAKLISRP